MKRNILLLILGIVVSLNGYSQNGKINWDTDLDFLTKELSEKHINFFTVKSKEDLLSGIEIIKQEKRGLNDLHVALKTQQLIAQFGDSHTSLNFYPLINQHQILPIHLFWASDGLYILHTTRENDEILGCKLLSINKVPVAMVIDSISTLFTMDNQSIIKNSVPSMVPYLEILHYFGFGNTTQVELGLEANSNTTFIYTLKPSLMNRNNRVSFKPDSLAFNVKNEKLFFTDWYSPEEKIYHLLYNKCWSKELELQYGNKENAEKMPSFKEFEDKAFHILENKLVEKVIFDLRYNGGGNSQQGTLFIEKLAKLLENNPETKVYVVTGRATFSSAILNAMDFKRLTNAIFVGEETAGKPNHFGEVKKFQLPDSKLEVNYSTKYFKRTNEDVRTFAPDVLIEMSFSDLTKGIDPVYEWIKQQ